ncbi:MAG TPA: cytochrome c oxidase subunit II [Steroidobacteraceae bacterium]|nr:cytochrome c oxidase subunit II [Steroidobacteraceae bacterium]
MMQGALDTAGPFAQHIAGLFWTFVAVTAVVYLVVMGFLIHALRRRSRAAAGEAPADTAKSLRVIGGAVIATAVVLVGLALSDFFAGRALARPPADAMRVQITAHQWWWEIEYPDANPSLRIRTANELHIPVGKPVALELISDDVIHSFWVPSLNGKRDLIPGYANSLALQASRPGVYQGKCAEFCGLQHAQMNVTVHAEDPQRFATWQASQRRPAPDPADAVAARGRDIFMNSTCAQCHAVQGTDAGATLGPDLTHVASRSTLAAGALPNNPQAMASWIRNPPAIKPGTRMPASQLSGDELAAVVTWLGSLR